MEAIARRNDAVGQDEEIEALTTRVKAVLDKLKQE